ALAYYFKLASITELSYRKEMYACDIIARCILAQIALDVNSAIKQLHRLLSIELTPFPFLF
ncbi:14199_t:CDS:1, partial [Dentiscutata erythropus]